MYEVYKKSYKLQEENKMKRLIRELTKKAIVAVFAVVFILAMWALSKLGGILPLLKENWLPLLIGFVTCAVLDAIVDTLMSGKDDTEEKENN